MAGWPSSDNETNGLVVLMRATWFRLSRHDAPQLGETEVYNPGDDEAVQMVQALSAKLATNQPQIDEWDAYYRGKQPLSFLHPEVALEVGDRLKSLVINLPRLALDTLESRLDVEGFRLPGQDRPDDDLWAIWQGSGMDLASGRGMNSAMRHGAAFVTVWTNPKKGAGTPKITVESAKQVVANYYPGTIDPRAVLKQWTDQGVTYANLMLPTRVIKYQKGNKPSGGATNGSWDVRDQLDNPLGRPPVVPLLNRYDIDTPDGESELADGVHIVDAINKLGTDMMVASEFHALPRRWATGLEIPKGVEGDRLREEIKAYWDNAVAGKTWTGGKGVAFGSFASAELQNFVHATTMLLQMFAAISGLPPYMVGLHSVNPASADAIRSSEAVLVKRAQRKQRTFGEPHEDVMRMAIQVRDGGADPAAERLETVWRSAETPTVAQKADAAVKLTTASIIDDQQAQEDLGYTPQQRAAMAKRRADMFVGLVNDTTSKRIEQAMDLVGQGVDEKIAFAALGLILPPKAVAAGPGAPPAPEGDPAIPPDPAVVEPPGPPAQTSEA